MDSVLFKKEKSALVENLRVLLHTNRNALVICIQNRCEQGSFFLSLLLLLVNCGQQTTSQYCKHCLSINK